MAVTALAACSDPAPRGDRAPHVILIIADTLRADHLGCYGYGSDTSPNIDRFAKEGLLFERCLSHAPDTRLSCAALLSGFLPHETSILDQGELPEAVRTLPELLHARGYATAAVISNYVLRNGQGYEQGFEIFDDTMEQRERVRQRWPERIAEQTTDRAIELLEASGDRPLFLWVHYQDPHGPYAPPPDFVRREAPGPRRPLGFSATLSGQGGIPAYQRLSAISDWRFYVDHYNGEIRYLDHHFGRLIRALQRLGVYDDSIVVFTSDHGEAMGEHDYYFAHGEYLYQHQIHVPLIMRWGSRFSGRRADYVQHVDLVPTLLSLLDIEDDAPFRGVDLFSGKGAPRDIVSQMRSPFAGDTPEISIMRDGLKLIHSLGERGDALYDVTVDPDEQRNLLLHEEYREKRDALMSRILSIWDEDRLGIEVLEPPDKPTPEELERLRSLGYVQ